VGTFFPGSTQKYLDSLSQIQSEMDTLQSQVTSGIRVSKPSDDPGALAAIQQSQTRISELQQSRTNLGELQTELNVGDSTLQNALKALDSAVSLASQASNPLGTPISISNLLSQAQGIQQTLVSLSATTSGGRYIFSGDQDQQALYVLDNTQPTGVRLVTPATSTRVVTDASGSQVWLARTATDIFDARNPDSTVASGNVFAAINSLVTALQNNDSSAALSSIDSLKAASDHLNQELGYFGVGETRAQDALDAAGKSLTTEQQNLSGLRDTDVAATAIQLSQNSVQQQAALSARANINKLPNLFDFLA